MKESHPNGLHFIRTLNAASKFVFIELFLPWINTSPILIKIIGLCPIVDFTKAFGMLESTHNCVL